MCAVHKTDTPGATSHSLLMHTHCTRNTHQPQPSGGILQDDWKNVHQHKLDILAIAHPNPTRWELTGTEVGGWLVCKAVCTVVGTSHHRALRGGSCQMWVPNPACWGLPELRWVCMAQQQRQQ